MKITLTFFSASALLVCSSPGLAALADPAAGQQILARYTRDIWPAVSAYNADHSQGGPAAKRFFALVDPSLDGEPWNSLREAAQQLGRQGEYDAADQTSHGNDGLTLGTAAVESVSRVGAALSVCYTYVHTWYVNIADMNRATAASQATFRLAEANNTWYLRGIADDHPVPKCGA